MSDRVERIREQMTKRKIDGLILTDIDNVRYATGFTGSTAAAVVTSKRAVILVDSRYILQAKGECKGFEPQLFTGDMLQAISSVVNEDAPASVGYEAEHMVCMTLDKLRIMVGEASDLVGVTSAIEDLRYVKTPEEIESIRLSVNLADDCFSHLLSFIKPGMTERDVSLEIYLFFYKHGAGLAFDSIVATGPNAACPHWQPTDAVIQPGHMLKLDFGSRLNGYNSDITRTIFIGEPDEKQKEVYNTVLQGQLNAIAVMKPGMIGKDVDAAARGCIASKGYGPNFGHGLGHSLGICTHDGPRMTAVSEAVLEPGVVMTVEPGIYIEGWGGVRIEDDVLITETGVEVLTKSTKEIVVI